MNCNCEMLIAHVLGDLDGEKTAAVEGHVKECASCAKRLVELRATLQLAATLPEAQDRPVSMSRLRSAIAEQESAKRAAAIPARMIARWRWGLALAAAAALAVLCFRYGVAVRVGQIEIALGGPGRSAASQPPAPETTVAMNEDAVRGLARDEITARIVPVLSKLVQTVEDSDARHHEDLVALRNAFAVQRLADLNEVGRNMNLIASTVDEQLGVR